MKKYIIIIIIIALVFLVALFWKDIIRIIKINNKADSNAIKLETKKFKVGLITGFGGLGDKSFNDMQYNGIILAKKLYGIDFLYFTPQNFQDILNNTQTLIDNECNLIILGEGYIGQKVIDIFAPKYPDIKFVVLDNIAERLYPNCASIVFKQNEASFLAGYLAASMTKKNKIGFIGGIDIDVIEDFYIGFHQGVKYYNDKLIVYKKFLSDYIKDFEKVWDNPERSYNIAKDLILKKEVDIIFAVAAASNIGVFNAAKEYSLFSIGVDTDQDYIVPGVILTSVMKNLDQAIVFIIRKILENKFESKIYYLGLKENGVALSPMLYTKDIIGEERIKELFILQKKIINNEIIVDSIFKKEK
jgi:basic membrane protein A